MKWSILLMAPAALASAVAHCPSIAPGPVAVSALASELSPNALPDVVAIESIRSTLALYPLAVDGKQFSALNKVFTENARANYSAPLGVLVGLSQIESVLNSSLSQFPHTQHLYGTQIIDICSTTSAISMTYYTATHYFVDVPFTSVVPLTEVLYAHGQYQDTWARQPDGTWRITNRNLVYMV